jgi:hypothetical protein
MTVEHNGKAYQITDTPTPKDFMKVSSAKMDICNGDNSVFHDNTNFAALYTAASIKTFAFLYAFCPELLKDMKILQEKPNGGITSAKDAYDACSMEVLSSLIQIGESVIGRIESIYNGYFEGQKKTEGQPGMM